MYTHTGFILFLTHVVFLSLKSEFIVNLGCALCCELFSCVDRATVSTELEDLLRKLLDKDPDKRISLSEVRMHPWILKTTRTIPSSDQNCLKEIDISEEDIKAAIKPFYTPIHILVCVFLCYVPYALYLVQFR